MNNSVFWGITPCSPLKVNRRFGGTCRLHGWLSTAAVRTSHLHNPVNALWGNTRNCWRLLLFNMWRRMIWWVVAAVSEEPTIFRVYDGGNTCLRNVGNDLTYYMTLHSRRQALSLFNAVRISNVENNPSLFWESQVNRPTHCVGRMRRCYC
jgi:hypothetical protein